MITPPSRYERLSARALAIGPTAFGRACASTMRAGVAPFSFTISMYGALIWSMTAARVIRIICATITQARDSTGSANDFSDERLADDDSAGSHRRCTAK